MATEHAVAEEIEAGMPQLDFSTFPNQIFWLIVTLVVIYLLLSRIALPRIGAVLAERSGTITNDLAIAEELKQRATDAEAAYEKALADARTQAQNIAAETKASIQSDLDKELAKADAEIATKSAEAEARLAEIRDQSASSVQEIATETAKAIVESFGGSADAKTITAAVTSGLKG